MIKPLLPMLICCTLGLVTPPGVDAEEPSPPPAVVEPAPEILSAHAAGTIEIAEFRSVYSAAGAPRIVLFLNDDHADLMSHWAARAGTQKYRPANAATAARFEAALTDTLLGVPVRLVDREAVMTRQGANDDPIDQQEMLVVERYADILAELLFINDPFSPEGFAVQVRALSVSDGSFMGSGLVAPGAEAENVALLEQTPGDASEKAERLGARTALELVRLLHRGLEQ